MPWGWECRAKLVKQNPIKPTNRTRSIVNEFQSPGPTHYNPPRVIGGKGYSKIKRAPAYSFGRVTPATFERSPVNATAPGLNLQGLTPKGPYKILHGVLTPVIDVPSDKTRIPGPNVYAVSNFKYKRPPAYTLKARARPAFVPSDSWTPSPNMYKPPLTSYTNNAPAYTLGNISRNIKTTEVPGPGVHDPKYDFVMKRKPAFSFGAPFRKKGLTSTPGSTSYCQKKFNVIHPRAPAISFGIKHSPYIGVRPEFRKDPDVDLKISAYVQQA